MPTTFFFVSFYIFLQVAGVNYRNFPWKVVDVKSKTQLLMEFQKKFSIFIFILFLCFSPLHKNIYHKTFHPY